MSAPRIRSIKPECWEDKRIGALSHEGRLLFCVLITMADDEGRLLARPRSILGHGYTYDDDVTPAKLGRWMAEVAASQVILTYEVDGEPYVAFRHWRRHQKINRPRASTLPAPPDPVVVSDNAVPPHGERTEDARNDHGTLTEVVVSDHVSVTGGSSLTRTSVPVRSDPDPEVPQLIDAHATGIEAEMIAVLRQLPRLYVDQIGVENAICAYPNADPILAARQVVAWASDPAFTATDAARLLMSALSKQKPAQVDEKAARTARRKEALKRVQEAAA